MQLMEVTGRDTVTAFLEVNALMNRSNPAYIRPLDKEVNDVFNPEKNKNFKYGDARRWILKDDNGQLIGRIAAFINSKYINKGTDFPTGGIGYFDCINDQQAANMLFDTAKTWLQSKGMEAMDGPINFGDRDKWWGLMVEGFDKEPMYGMSFNPPYYEQLFEGYGFQNYYNQFYYSMKVDDPLPPRFPERHAKFKAKPGYVAKHVNLNELEKYAGDFATVYNAAWAQHGEGKEVTKEQVLKLFKSMKPIMDERVVWFAYYKEDPIAMFINIPDVNQYFKHFNGKFGLLQKLHLLWMKKRGVNKRLTGLAFGVVPKYQSLGIDSFMIYESALLIQNKGWYEEYEMGWAGEWNPKMLNVYKSLGGVPSRRMITYRYLFDHTKNFERHPEMEYKI
ncbi:hypothetical protein SAMN05444410_107131 [Hydrobacter penzbergensis]|uniref:N-acetyltransferase domain-containing protein n=1 Tax=Hydrobacter penzbergensis TaxID=1235997 RepID=A0A8X8LBI5_9BACT|nr:hypothetical protein [Hydrobacter penzbergensis]SDW94877.1 hypothetical protein SAMN05444410_107131 [Hydrobacter penzbergensis]